MHMKAQVLKKQAPIESAPLELTDLPVPEPGPGQVLVEVSACGVCHTELDEIEGRLTPHLPIVPGHEVVGRVVAVGKNVRKYRKGDRVGIGWIYSACGKCRFCRAGLENLCADFKATGCDPDGGYAEYMVVPQESAFPVPQAFSDAQAAPLLCAGAIGYRDLRLAGIQPGQTLGLFGFGASAHIVIQLARHQGCEVFVLTRGEEHRRLAEQLGANWTGSPDDTPPRKLDRAIDFTPVGETVPRALELLDGGGKLVIAVIRKRTPVPPIDYGRLLWHEREIKSIANITRRDLSEFLPLAAEIGIKTEVQEYPLKEANRVLKMLKDGTVRGAAVLRIRGGNGS